MTSKTPAAPILRTAPSESLYGLLFQNSLDGLMLTALDGSILDANPAACRIVGRSREEILHEGRPGLIDASDPRLAALIADRQRTGRAYGELRARRKDGSLFPIELSSVVFQSPDGDSRTCIIIRDITERRAAEAERERLINELHEALGRVKSFVGLTAHLCFVPQDPRHAGHLAQSGGLHSQPYGCGLHPQHLPGLP